MRYFVAIAASACVLACSPQTVRKDVTAPFSSRTLTFSRVNQNLPAEEKVVSEVIQAMKAASTLPKNLTVSPLANSLDIKYIFADRSGTSIHAQECSASLAIRTQKSPDSVKLVLLAMSPIAVSASKRTDWSDPFMLAIVAAGEAVNEATGWGEMTPEQRLAVTERKCTEDIGLLSSFKRLRFDYAEEISGEVNSQYPDNAVYANFQRLLPTSEWKGSATNVDIEKTKTFRLDSGGTSASIRIAVYPYQRGSKVVYVIRYPYSLNDDGTTTYSAAAIEDLRRRVVAIANN